jgi:hypothetical protein
LSPFHPSFAAGEAPAGERGGSCFFARERETR